MAQKSDFIFGQSEYKKIYNFAKSVSDNYLNEKERLSNIFTCIDNTTLRGTDSPLSVEKFCLHSAALKLPIQGNNTVAAVCVYPNFVSLAKKTLGNHTLKVASVAGGFPSGQLPSSLKFDEVRYAIDEGADEIDIVINRGLFLQGERQEVFDEIAHSKDICGDKTLKVIIESCELETPELIYDATFLALSAGADFIKTSTGKGAAGATPVAAFSMLSALRDFCKKNKKNAGFKAAGGISSLPEALIYYCLAEKILQTENISNQIFRIGASRLTDELFNFLTV